MICPKCKNEIPDNSIFCSVCGEKIQPEQPASDTTVSEEDTAQESTVAESDDVLAPTDSPIFSDEEKKSITERIKQCIQMLLQNKKRLFIAAGSLLIVVLLIVLIVGKMNTAENTAKKYLKAVYSCDFKKSISYEILDENSVKSYIESIALRLYDSEEEFYDDVSASLGTSVNSVDDLFSAFKKESAAINGNAKITVSILGTYELSESKRMEFIEDSEEKFDDLIDEGIYVKSGKIGSVKKVKYKIHSEGDSNKNTFDKSDILYLVKINGSWCVVSSDFSETVDGLIDALSNVEK